MGKISRKIQAIYAVRTLAKAETGGDFFAKLTLVFQIGIYDVLYTVQIKVI